MNGRLGVFCLEGDWSPNLTKSMSVRPLLELMRSVGQVRSVHRDVGTTYELEHYVRIWLDQKRYEPYSLGWFAFHGSPGHLHVGRTRLSLDQLVDLFGRGACAGRTIYFGSCGTVDIDTAELAAFRSEIGARVVCGYREDPYWTEAAAFELLLMETLGSYKQLAAAFKSMRKEYGGLADRLGFISDPSWTSGQT